MIRRRPGHVHERYPVQGLNGGALGEDGIETGRQDLRLRLRLRLRWLALVGLQVGVQIPDSPRGPATGPRAGVR